MSNSLTRVIEEFPPSQSGRFYVAIDNEVVAYFQECTGLSTEVEIQEYAEGGNNEFVHKLPGRRKFSNITLKRGFSDNMEFAQWRPRFEGGKLAVKRKEISIILFSHDGET